MQRSRKIEYKFASKSIKTFTSAENNSNELEKNNLNEIVHN
jgi:hypothetical protein